MKAPIFLLTQVISLFAVTSSFVVKAPRRSSSSSMAKKKVFIDGEAGTTGIQVRDRLSERTNDLEIISLPIELRKDEATRKKFINDADAVILCAYSWRDLHFLALPHAFIISLSLQVYPMMPHGKLRRGWKMIIQS